MTENSENVRLSATIYGRVQGVYFRESTRARANAAGIVGWVRNAPDGAVEVCAEGRRADLKTFLEFLHVGPPAAQVTHVASTWEDAAGEYSEFRTRWF